MTIDDRSIILVKMKGSTKDEIIKSAFELIHKKGFNNTGIQEILVSAGVPKGSFYFYFKNKDDLGLQLIDYYIGSVIALADEMLLSDNSPLLQLRLFLDQLAKSCEKAGFQGGCLVGNMAQESGGLNDMFHTKLERAFGAMQEKIGEFLRKAVEKNELPNTTKIPETAGFILSSMEGVLLQMKAVKNTEPYRVFDQIIFDKVLK